MLGAFMAARIADTARTFDNLIGQAGQLLPQWFEEYANAERAGDACSTLYLIGWHEQARRPAAYAMDMWTVMSSRHQQVMENSANAADIKPFAIEEQLVAGTPLPGPDLCAAAGFQVPDDENDMDPDVDLLHLLEIQRHERIEGAHWVGGGAWLTSVDRHGVRQREIHRWEEDEVGAPITPLPIDWSSRKRRRPGFIQKLLRLG